MKDGSSRCLQRLVVVALSVAIQAGSALAFSAGVTTEAFSPAVGCNQCHSGGTIPVVRLTGPTLVTPGSVNEYSFEVDTVGAQNKAGLNVSAPAGELQVGGADSAGTQQLSLILDPSVQEITHTGAKSPVSGTVHFSFLWQAPLTPGVTTILAWGNAVDGTGSFLGDSAQDDELDVTVAAAPAGIDAYKCYQGKDLKTPKFTKLKCPGGANTSDQFGSECVDVQKVKFVCNPVSVDGSAIIDPSAHLICYQIKGASLAPRPRVEVNTQFQTTQFELKKPKLICVPGTKTVLP